MMPARVSFSSVRRLGGFALAGLAALGLLACSSGPDKPKPAELAPVTALLGVRSAWTVRLPSATDFGLQIGVAPGSVAVASGDGTVMMLESGSGRTLWSAQAGDRLSAGVGTDGRLAAVVTRGNAVAVLEDGRMLWKQPLPALAHTAPLVAGQRVFVLTADRSVIAFDGRGGRKLWNIQRVGEPLVLQQAGLLQAVGDTLVVGIGGRMIGLNPNTGAVRWEAALASPRGTNDVERLVDLVAGTSRQGNVVCARAYQASVGCVDTTRGTVLWTRPSNSATGISGDGQAIYGTEGDGKLVAWRRADGERLWTNESLRFRGVGTPLLAGRSLIVGDANGLVHVLSREDGSSLNRLSTDGSAIRGAPVLVGDVLVVATQAGGVHAFRPD